MSKRTITEVTQSPGQPYAKAKSGGAKRDDASVDEMGEFEDAWEDELESDEEVIDGGEGEDEDGALAVLCNLFQFVTLNSRHGS